MRFFVYLSGLVLAILVACLSIALSWSGGLTFLVCLGAATLYVVVVISWAIYDQSGGTRADRR